MITLIVAQKQINLRKSIAVTSSALIALALSGNGLSAKVSEARSANRTFAEMCRAIARDHIFIRINK